MNKVILTNPSDFTRRGWCEVAVPYEKLANTPKDTWLRFKHDGGFWPANRGPDIGTESVLVFVYGEWANHQQIIGELVEQSGPAPFVEFSPTDWVVDRIHDIIMHPQIQLERNGPVFRAYEREHLEQLESGPVREVWRRRVRLKDTMLWFDQIAYFYSFQDAVKIECAFTCSDPEITDTSQPFWTLGVASGEYFELDFRDKWQLPLPARAKSEWHQVLAKPSEGSLDDGQQLPHSGWLLCLPVDKSTINIGNPDHLRRLLSLVAFTNHPDIAIRRGPIAGCSTQWKSKFGPHRAIPVATSGHPTTKNNETLNWLNYIDSPGHLYQELPWGLAKFPGQTGGQEDFGSCKGTGVHTLQAPLLIEKYRFIARSEAMRPYHHREIDGSPLVAADHPNWRTWSERTDTRQAHATDTLGKVMIPPGFPPKIFGTGFGSKDDQHCQMNNFAAALAFTGSYQMQDVYFDKLQTDLAQYENRFGAPRAIGRLFQTWAQMRRLMPPSEVVLLLGHVDERVQFTLQNWRGGTHNNSVKILASGRQPGMVGPAWIVWEHAIAVRGIAALSKVFPTLTADLEELALKVGTTVTMYGTYHDGVKWRCCTGVAYENEGTEHEGLPLAPSFYFDGSPKVATWDAFWNWTLPAIIVAKELSSPGSEVFNRASDIIAQNRALVPNWNAAEWHAVTQF